MNRLPCILSAALRPLPPLTIGALSLTLLQGCMVHPHRTRYAEPPHHPGARETQMPEGSPQAAVSGAERRVEVDLDRDTPQPPRRRAARRRAGRTSAPIICRGASDLRIDGRDIHTARDGIVILGSCDIYLTNTTVSADGCAILIQGSGDVKVENSDLSGGQGVVCIRGSGDVAVRNTHLRGQILTTGSGDFVDNGGNTWD